MSNHPLAGPKKTDGDNHLWLKLWRDRLTDFHQHMVNKFLAAFWPKLDLMEGSRVFVPLCGKSIDMIWLEKQGFEVIGVELSPVAVEAFFHENRLTPIKRRVGKFTLWKHGSISILCGDYFSLKESDLGRIDAVYDRAALTALPEDIRKHYVAHLKLIAPAADIFLLTVEDFKGELCQQGPCVDEEINSLYSDEFIIKLTHVEREIENEAQSFKQPLTRTEYKVYRLSCKTNRNSQNITRTRSDLI